KSKSCKAVNAARHSMMSAGRDASLAVRQGDTNVLHHSLIFMVEDVAVQDKIPNVPLISAARDRVITRLDEKRVTPDTFEVGVLRIVGLAVDADVHAGGIADRHDLERVDVDMKGMSDRRIGAGGDVPFVRRAQHERAVDAVRIVRLSVHLELQAIADVDLQF